MNPALKKKLYHYAMVTLACAIMGIAMNTFYMPNKMLSGGIGGVAVLAYYVAGLPMGATSLICNVPLFFLAYKYMDREYTISALYGIIAFSVSLDFFHFLSTYTVVHDKLLACIAGGVLYGIGAACMYFAFNICLLLASVSLFGIEPVLYTLLTFFVMTKTCNAFTTGFDYKKKVIIISEHHEEIAEAIIKIVGRGVTYISGEGCFTHRHRELVFVVIKLTQLAKVRSIVREIDPSAFMIISDVNDVFGRGFTLKPSGPNFPRPKFPEKHE